MARELPDSSVPRGAPLRRCQSSSGGKFQAALLSGGVAGCIAKTATAPLSRLTVLAQTSSLVACSSSAAAYCPLAPEKRAFSDGRILLGLKHIYRNEGLSALWKGNLCTCLHRFPMTGVNFAVFERVTLGLGDGWRATALGRFVPGAIAGCTSVTICYPLEIVRTRLMAQMKRKGSVSTWHASLAELLRKEGISGLYRGIGMSLSVSAPSISISFGVYNIIKEQIQHAGMSGTSFPATVIAGGTSGIVGSILTYPMDVLRRRLQVMGMDTSIPRRSWLEEARHILQTEGKRGFWRGLTPELVKIFPTVAITFVVFENLRVFI
eukprot:TRINITY_DN72313_c0_g1_i1.p1 TRINITY_DN72313_c0_g1~~TRINITY_DN72313_c0_g1_i1.p1  ORF type:complete len:334 (+),score=34.54 TRINITY_DN72313_c0_g1_i1:37-1002(+)